MITYVSENESNTNLITRGLDSDCALTRMLAKRLEEGSPDSYLASDVDDLIQEVSGCFPSEDFLQPSIEILEKCCVGRKKDQMKDMIEDVIKELENIQTEVKGQIEYANSKFRDMEYD